MNVKLQGLLGGARSIREAHGPEALDAIVAACRPVIRSRIESGIAINWHPVSELVEFLHAAEQHLGTGRGEVAEEIGAAGARANTSGTIARAVFYLARPSFLLRRLTGLWDRFNDQGSMELLELDEARHTLKLEIRGVPDPDWLFCCTITGWGRVVAARVYADDARVRHVECRARGAERCIWEGRWGSVGRRST